MKIIDQGFDMLVLEERPWLLGSLLTLSWVASVWGLLGQWDDMSIGARSALGFWVVALPFGISAFVQFVEVRFDRRKALVSVSHRALFRPHHESYPLAHFRRARVQASRSSEGPGYRLVLTFDEAILGEMDPTTLQTRTRRYRRGFRHTAPHEIPVTAYFSGADSATNDVELINAWVATEDTP